VGQQTFDVRFGRSRIRTPSQLKILSFPNRNVGSLCFPFRNAGPLLLGAMFTVLPLYMLLFWDDLAATVGATKQRATERMPFGLRLNLSAQWAAISVGIGAPLMVSILSVVLWFTYMKQGWPG
jgi:hypothetical protein